MKQIFSLFFLLAVVSCSNDFVIARYQYEENRITAENPADEKLWKQILPYKDSLDKEMNIVLAVSDTFLTKSVPESDLGNLMCDLILKKSRDYSGQPVHFTFLNNGGIRIPNLPRETLLSPT